MLTVGEWLRDAFREVFAADGRLWLTLRRLFFSPGRLAADWERGRRQKTMSPVRLYLFAAACFFFASTLVPNQSNVIVDFASGWVNSGGAIAGTVEGATPSDVVIPRIAGFVDRSMKWIMLLLMVPALAAVTRLVFGRKGEYYARHLVASLHLHSFLYFCMGAFLAVLLAAGFAQDPDSAGDLGVMFVVPLVLLYFTVQSRRLFQRGWLSTLIRVGVVTVAYVAVLIAVSVALSVVASLTA